MPRKRKQDQAGRFAKGRKHSHQWPLPPVWGSGPFAERALDRWWFARNECDMEECGDCARELRLTRQRGMYGRRR